MIVKLDDTFYLHIGTSAPSTGAATNADSTPVVTIEEDGVALGYSPAVANVATGLYRITIVATTGNGFEAGKRYSIYVVATVSTVTGRDGIGEFECAARSQDDLAAPGDAMTLSSAAVDAILDDAVEGSYSLRHLTRLMAAALIGKVSGGGTATVVFRSADDSKNRITTTIDINGNRTAVTLDET